jgi:hypothetical protein
MLQKFKNKLLEIQAAYFFCTQIAVGNFTDNFFLY